MRMVWNGAALAAILALVVVAALNAGGAPALASVKAGPATLKTPGGKFADRLPSTLPAAFVPGR